MQALVHRVLCQRQ